MEVGGFSERIRPESQIPSALQLVKTAMSAPFPD
jgi:hypothetical protein